MEESCGICPENLFLSLVPQLGEQMSSLIFGSGDNFEFSVAELKKQVSIILGKEGANGDCLRAKPQFKNQGGKQL